MNLTGNHQDKDAYKNRSVFFLEVGKFRFVAILLQLFGSPAVAGRSGQGVRWERAGRVVGVENFFVGKSGRKWSKYLLLNQFNWKSVYMGHLIGEFDCKLDTKGRMVFPAALKRQMPDVEREGLVINRGFERHLVLYPRKEWDKITAKLAKLNTYKARNRKFIRDFTRGATELTLDAAGRVLLPKSLLEYGGIETEVVLACQFNKIEVWSKEAYNKLWEDDADEDFAALAEEVMGGDDLPDDEDE